MTRLAEAVAGGELSDEEMAQLRGALAQLAAVAGASNGELAGALASADRELGTGDRAAAARHLLAASPKMKALHGAMAARSLAERTTETLDLLARATRAEAEDLGRGPGSPARRPGEPPGMLASGAGAGGPDSSRGSSIGTRPVGEPNEDGARGPELPIAGQWRGKVLRQLFESTSAKSPSDALRLAIVEHQRVVEDRFQHDEVPEEYQEAVRAYFALLSARESSWMSIKK
jgi:hypothetical protein